MSTTKPPPPAILVAFGFLLGVVVGGGTVEVVGPFEVACEPVPTAIVRPDGE
jgi:hypothetical protein